MIMMNGILKRSGLLLASAILLAASFVQPLMAAPTIDGVNPRDLLHYYTDNGIIFYDGGKVYCDNGGVAGVPAGPVVNASEAQAANAKIVIGVAKTYNLGKEGALIGLITGLAESNLRSLANDGIPISQSSPDKQGSGGDHDSVGTFQQRPSTGWSTFGNETNQQTVWQIMDTRYAAQAFFGTPPGAKLPEGLAQPSALKKGLQNKTGWQTLPPWIAAQRVQVSAFSDGSNYRAKMDQAQGLLDKYWDTTEPLPLRIPVEGISNTPSSPTGDCPAAGGNSNLNQVVLKYAWPKYIKDPGLAPIPTVGYAAAIVSARARDIYVGNPAETDCGGFVTVVMHDTLKDTTYNSKKSNVIGQKEYLDGNPTKYELLKPKALTDLKPGDIYIEKGLGHTFMFVGSIPGFDGNIAEASQYQRSPMASWVRDATDGYWYRHK